MRPDVEHWYRRRTYAGDPPSPGRLLASLGHRTVTVLLPALNEERTIGPIVASLHREYVERVPLIGELLVIDSGSTDATVAVARAAGADVVAAGAVLPELGPARGKGEALWKGLAATGGELVVFLDTDVVGFDHTWLPRLLAPLVADEAVQLVKGCYDRPLVRGDAATEGAGGRVTELLARPLLAAFWPELSGLVQPLAGECAARRDLLEQLPFVTSYGVELALLVDTLQVAGLDALAQVDLGRRVHRNQDGAALGRMAAAILQTALHRLQRQGRADLLADAGPLVQFARGAAGAWEPTAATTSDAVVERPALTELVPYSRPATLAV
ncbi:MAG TPA: glucosyl-3-phosphoglycerate synthase [Frankiaceae bacterium]